MPRVLSAPAIAVNDSPVSIVPNSCVYNEGFGEQTVRAASTGGGSVEQVYSEDIESKFSMVKFAIYPTVANIELARAWKANDNLNVVTIAGNDGAGNSFARTFQNAGITVNYDVALGSETVIEIEFLSDAAA